MLQFFWTVQLQNNNSSLITQLKLSFSFLVCTKVYILMGQYKDSVTGCEFDEWIFFGDN